MMTRSRISNLIVLLCGLLVGFTLLTNVPSLELIRDNGGPFTLYAFLTALMLILSVLLTEGEFSVAHLVGITGFLSLPISAQPVVLWALFIGGIVGSTFLVLRGDDANLRRHMTIQRRTGSIVMICARLILSLFVAGGLYDVLGGTHPLVPPLPHVAVPLLAFSVLYCFLYTAIFLLETYVETRSIARMLRENGLMLAAMLSIPMPFAILSAVVLSVTPSSVFMFLLGAVLAAVGLYRFNRTSYRLKKQLEEQRSLSAVSQALQAALKLDSLLFAIYNQVAQLMYVDQYVTALYARNSQNLQFPLVMQHGKAVTTYREDTADSPLGRVLHSQIPVLITPDNVEQGGNHSWLGVPLLAGGRLLGAIAVRSDDIRHPFTEDDLRLLNVVAASAGVAIDNAQLYELQITRAARMAALNRTLPLLTGTLALDTVQETIVTAASEILQSDGVALYLEGADAKSPMQVVASQGLVHVNEIWSPDEIVKHEKKSTYLGLDLVIGNDRLGGLAFFFNEGHSYNEEDTPIALAFAAQAAQAIRNAKQYTTTDRALEEQMRRVTVTRDRLQVILNTITEGILLIDRDGVVSLANPRVDVVGLVATDLNDQHIDRLLDKPYIRLAERMGFESDQQVRDLLKRVHAPDDWRDETFSYMLKTDEDERHIERSSVLVKGANHEVLGVMLAFSDETEAHELAQMRSDLSNMIVHDLRSPLTAVTTGLKLLRDIIPSESPLRATVVSTTETSQRAIRKMLVRVDSLLDISRLDSGALSLETEPTDVATLADGVCVELSPLAQELDVTLTTDIGDEIPALDADSDKVERVLQNLVDNALKFCPARGKVTIRAHQAQTDAAGDRFVRIDVSDSGPGIPDEYKTRLFDRYAQMKGRRGKRRGSGLGLTFCRMVVEAHGGRIWIEDNPGGGSVFAFTLPVAETTDPNE